MLLIDSVSASGQIFFTILFKILPGPISINCFTSSFSMFNIVDSFDTHAKVPEHFASLEEAAEKAGTLGAMSVGWDPGLFPYL